MNNNNQNSVEHKNKSASEQSAPPSLDNEMLLGILAYLGPLIIVSFILAKDKNNSFVKFHVRQGAILFVADIIVWIVGAFLWQFWFIWNLVNLAIFILAIFGIVNVIQHKEKELPFVGHLSSNFKF